MDFLADITYPLIKVHVWWRGATPDELDREVADPIEREMSTVNGLDYLESSSIEGMYTLQANFRYGVDVDVAYQDALAAMARAARFLPKDIDPPFARTYGEFASLDDIRDVVVSGNGDARVRLRDIIAALNGVRNAAVEAAVSEVGPAVIASTVSFLALFLPFLLVPGPASLLLPGTDPGGRWHHEHQPGQRRGGDAGGDGAAAARRRRRAPRVPLRARRGPGPRRLCGLPALRADPPAGRLLCCSRPCWRAAGWPCPAWAASSCPAWTTAA